VDVLSAVVNTSDIKTNSVNFLKEVISSSPGLILVIEPEQYRIVYCDERFTKYFGFELNDACGGNFSLLRIVHDQEQDRFKTQVAEVEGVENARKKYVVYRLKNSKGEFHSFYIYITPVNGEKLFHLLILPDTTQQGLPFTSFDSRELYFEHFHSDAAGTFEWDKKTGKVFWTTGVYRIFEISDEIEEFNWAAISQYINPEDKEYVATSLQGVLAGNGDSKVEFKILTAHGNTKVVEALCRAVRNKHGEIEKMVGSVRDITEQRNIELSLQSHVEELNRSNKELEEFAYVASHDLQEPLRKITTFSDRLKDRYADALTGEGAMYLERMTASAENMRMLINNLLEFSRVTRSTQPFQEVDLSFIVQQVRADVELVMDETSTQILTMPLPTVEASISQMKQLFSNIILNAIKFRKQNLPPVITIDTAEVTKLDKKKYKLFPDLTYYKIQITDNGIGFENEYATRIFQIFQRLHGKSEYPGSGIGLAICKKIMEHHHGVIFAESVPEQGARFTFIIPEKQPNTKK
jgi:PAS domain S-box-containing protein